MTGAKLSRVLAVGLTLIVSTATCKHDNTTPDDDVTLEVSTSGDGSGYVSNDATLGSCPPLCLFGFDRGATVTLTATPDPGSLFVSWSGDCVGSAASVTLTVQADAACDARFDRDGSVAVLTVTIDSTPGYGGKVLGQGIDCGDGATDCSEAYPLNSSVHLTMWKPAASVFLGWSDDCLGFTSAPEIDLPMTADKSCTASFGVGSGGFQPKGAFSFPYRVEAGALLGTRLLTVGYDMPAGEIIDVSNPEQLTSPAGPEFNACSFARGMTTYFNSRPQYNADVAFTTCPDARQGALTPGTGGFTEIQIYNFAPGKAAHYQLNWVAMADFEFGRLRLIDQSAVPQSPVQIPLSGAERSCPFDVEIRAGFAYVAGREGVAGTATANCNNWTGAWKVDLALNTVVSFTKFGTKIRDIEYGDDNRVYATDFDEDRVYVLNGATMAVERSFNVCDGPVGMKLTSMATGMFLTCWNTNKVQYWNLTNDTLVDEEDSGGIHPVDVWTSGINGFVLNFGDAGANIGGSLRAFQYSF